MKTVSKDAVFFCFRSKTIFVFFEDWSRVPLYLFLQENNEKEQISVKQKKDAASPGAKFERHFFVRRFGKISVNLIKPKNG
ncbi:hypothetical protein SAMN05443292_1064 [Halpernia frigidisoli]|uniref:Uncharacterized protein n=1 Tax=Halpernia frigidisoli TaxID=1125876 RepID=A0A1I3EGD8_9FLAO|nr:hypothetical protein SAMN05443292_1064 [Halpernia frigidisoli]